MYVLYQNTPYSYKIACQRLSSMILDMHSVGGNYLTRVYRVFTFVLLLIWMPLTKGCGSLTVIQNIAAASLKNAQTPAMVCNFIHALMPCLWFYIY